MTPNMITAHWEPANISQGNTLEWMQIDDQDAVDAVDAANPIIGNNVILTAPLPGVHEFSSEYSIMGHTYNTR